MTFASGVAATAKGRYGKGIDASGVSAGVLRICNVAILSDDELFNEDEVSADMDDDDLE